MISKNKNLNIGMIVLFVSVICIQGCGTTSTFKTAKLTDSEGIDVSLGYTQTQIPFFEKKYSDDYSSSTFVSDTRSYKTPEISAWSRIGDDKSPIDVGLTFAPLPMGISAYGRLHLYPGKFLIPEVTTGLMVRSFSNGIRGWKPGNTDTYTDLGIPIYLSWELGNTWGSEIYFNIIPLTRSYRSDSSPWVVESIKTTYDTKGVQGTVGLRLKFLYVEYGVLALTEKVYQQHLGFAVSVNIPLFK